MNVTLGYGRFVAAVNSLLLVFFCLNLAQAQAQTVKIAMLGDSLTAGYGLPPAQALPVKIEAALKAKGKDVQILNHGVSGDTAAGGPRARRLDAGRQARHRPGGAGRQRRACAAAIRRSSSATSTRSSPS